MGRLEDIRARLPSASRILRGAPVTDGQRLLRYFHFYLFIVAFIWFPIMGYILFWPEKFTSNFTLVLPNPGLSDVVKIDSIGQATSSSTSPYATNSLSYGGLAAGIFGAIGTYRTGAEYQ